MNGTDPTKCEQLEQVVAVFRRLTHVDWDDWENQNIDGMLTDTPENRKLAADLAENNLLNPANVSGAGPMPVTLLLQGLQSEHAYFARDLESMLANKEITRYRAPACFYLERTGDEPEGTAASAGYLHPQENAQEPPQFRKR